MPNVRSLIGRLRRTRTLAWVLACLAVGLTMFRSSQAFADPADRVAYSQQQVYSAAVRYLRIDLRYEIVERDPDAAYLLFEYQPLGQKDARFGAVEIVKLQQGVRLAVRLPDQPSYQETMLRDGLVKKLRSDYGEITPAKRDNGANTKEDRESERDPKDPQKAPKADRPNARS